MFKIGDKIICKKSYIITKCYYISGKMYEVLEIDCVPNKPFFGSYIWTTSESDYKYWIWSGEGENKNYLRFEDYFYTEKELRKAKLEKLKNI